MTSTASRPIIDTDLVQLDVDAGADKQAVIARLVDSLADAGRTSDAEGLTAAAMAREEQSATGLPGGIAIPHCRSPHVDTASIGFARLQPPVDFGAPDGPADLAFLIAAPEAGGAEHMKLLSSLARALVRKEFVQSLRDAKSPDEVVGLVDEVLNPGEKPKPAGPAETSAADAPKTLVAITACPTGIAHTYMAADSLVAAAKDAGRDAARRDAGLVRQHAARSVDDRRRRRRHLRHRCRREGQGSLRGQAGRRVRSQAGDQRAGQDGRRSACRRGQSECRPGRGLRCRHTGQQRPRRRCRLGHPHPADPAHRCELHDSVRRGRRSAHRARLPVRRIRDRQLPGRRETLAAIRVRLDRPRHRQHELAHQPALRRPDAIPRRGAVHPRRAGIHVPRPSTGRLHLVRDRRPSWHRTGIHRGRCRRVRRRRLHRRHRRRPHRRIHGVVDQPDRHSEVAPRPDAGGDHSAVRVACRRPADVPATRSPTGRHHVGPDQLAQWHDGNLGHHPRRHPRPDDVLRPRRTRKQGGLRLRYRGPQRRRPGVATHHGRGDGRRHGTAARDGSGGHGATGFVHGAGAGKWQGGLASRRIFHLRGRYPVRCGGPAARHPVDDVRRRNHRCADHGVRCHAQGSARRDLRVLRHRQPALVPGMPSRSAQWQERSPSSPPSSSRSPSAKIDETPALATA